MLVVLKGTLLQQRLNFTIHTYACGHVIVNCTLFSTCLPPGDQMHSTLIKRRRQPD